jgi:hypothetical protein
MVVMQGYAKPRRALHAFGELGVYVIAVIARVVREIHNLGSCAKRL